MGPVPPDRRRPRRAGAPVRRTGREEVRAARPGGWIDRDEHQGVLPESAPAHMRGGVPLRVPVGAVGGLSRGWGRGRSRGWCWCWSRGWRRRPPRRPAVGPFRPPARIAPRRDALVGGSRHRRLPIRIRIRRRLPSGAHRRRTRRARVPPSGPRVPGGGVGGGTGSCRPSLAHRARLLPLRQADGGASPGGFVLGDHDCRDRSASRGDAGGPLLRPCRGLPFRGIGVRAARARGPSSAVSHPGRGLPGLCGRRALLPARPEGSPGAARRSRARRSGQRPGHLGRSRRPSSRRRPVLRNGPHRLAPRDGRTRGERPRLLRLRAAAQPHPVHLSDGADPVVHPRRRRGSRPRPGEGPRPFARLRLGERVRLGGGRRGCRTPRRQRPDRAPESLGPRGGERGVRRPRPVHVRLLHLRASRRLDHARIRMDESGRTRRRLRGGGGDGGRLRPHRGAVRRRADGRRRSLHRSGRGRGAGQPRPVGDGIRNGGAVARARRVVAALAAPGRAVDGHPPAGGRGRAPRRGRVPPRADRAASGGAGRVGGRRRVGRRRPRLGRLEATGAGGALRGGGGRARGGGVCGGPGRGGFDRGERPPASDGRRAALPDGPGDGGRARTVRVHRHQGTRRAERTRRGARAGRGGGALRHARLLRGLVRVVQGDGGDHVSRPSGTRGPRRGQGPARGRDRERRRRPGPDDAPRGPRASRDPSSSAPTGGSSGATAPWATRTRRLTKRVAGATNAA